VPSASKRRKGGERMPYLTSDEAGKLLRGDDVGCRVVREGERTRKKSDLPSKESAYNLARAWDI